MYNNAQQFLLALSWEQSSVTVMFSVTKQTALKWSHYYLMISCITGDFRNQFIHQVRSDTGHT